MIYLMLNIGVSGNKNKPVINTWFGNHRYYECTSYTTNDIAEIKKMLSDNYQSCIGVVDPDTMSTSIDRKHLLEIEDTISLFEKKGININRLSDKDYVKHVTDKLLVLKPNDQLIYLEKDMGDIDDGHNGYLWEIYITVYTVVSECKRDIRNS